MSKRLPALHAKQCKKFAEDCLIWAKTARSETERTVFWRVPALSRQLIANTRMLDRAGGLSARLDFLLIGGSRDDEGDDAHPSSDRLVFAGPC